MPTTTRSTASQSTYDLGMAFPSLRPALERAGRDGETVQALIDHARSPAATSGSLSAARFVLEVYNPEIGRGNPDLQFRLHEAIGAWDRWHLAAFLTWVKNPYYL